MSDARGSAPADQVSGGGPAPRRGGRPAGWARRAATVLLLAGLGLAIALGLRPPPPVARVAVVARGPLAATITEEGRTRVIDRYVVSAPVPGFVHRIALQVGDPVTAGERLALLEPARSAGLDPRSRAEARARVEAAQALVHKVEQDAQAAASEAELARVELERAERLREAGAAGQEALDQAGARARRAQAATRSAEFAVQVARHELEAARATLLWAASEAPPAADEKLPVTSPVDGCVLRRARESEGAVAMGEPLVEVGDPRALEVEVDVLSTDAVRLTPGLAVVLERWGGEHALDGRVRRVEPVGFTKVSALGVEEQRVLVIVELLSPPERWAKLGHGYRVEATFVLWRGDDVLQVPTSAVRRGPDGPAVFVVDAGGVARRRPVALGHGSDLAWEVRDGLAAGERVVTHPGDDVADGVAVRVTE